MMAGAPLCGTPTNVATEDEDRPAIHISLAAGLDENFFNWVAIGAEEEGVPCRQVLAQSSDPVTLAYDAAMSSRFGVGVGVSGSAIVIHELHMPPEQPVIKFENIEKLLPYCRLAGGNAARLVIRLPFRFKLDSDLPVAKLRRTRALEPKRVNAEPATDPALVRAIASAVARIIQERGLL
jgi:hypothetical protein